MLYFNFFKPSEGIIPYAAIYLSKWYHAGWKYAVTACGSVQTTCHIYSQYEGMEYGSSTARFYCEIASMEKGLGPGSVLHDMSEQPSIVVYDMPDEVMYTAQRFGLITIRSKSDWK